MTFRSTNCSPRSFGADQVSLWGTIMHNLGSCSPYPVVRARFKCRSFLGKYGPFLIHLHRQDITHISWCLTLQCKCVLSHAFTWTRTLFIWWLVCFELTSSVCCSTELGNTFSCSDALGGGLRSHHCQKLLPILVT